MRRFSQLLPVILLALTAVGCQIGQGRLGPSGLPTGGIAHIVVIWMTDRGDEFAKKQLLADAKKLESVPGVVAVAAGRMLPSDRANVDKSFDIAFVITFRDEAALKQYAKEKTQLDTMTDVARFAREIKVYDAVAD